MRKIIIILSIAFALGIGVFQINRIDNTYFTYYVAKSQDIPNQPQLGMFQSPDTLYDCGNGVDRSDNTSGNTIPSQPTDRALEAKFWLDPMGSFITALTPLLVPIVLYRKNRGEEDESD